MLTSVDLKKKLLIEAENELPKYKEKAKKVDEKKIKEWGTALEATTKTEGFHIIESYIFRRLRENVNREKNDEERMVGLRVNDQWEDMLKFINWQILLWHDLRSRKDK